MAYEPIGESEVFEVMRTARSIRRYRPEPVPEEVVHRCLQAATWAPSGGNQQQWHFIRIESRPLRDILTAGAQRSWETMKSFYDIDVPAESDRSSRARTLRAMHRHMTTGANVPVCILFCSEPQRGTSKLEQGASIFPAMQNFLVAARAQGLGAAITLWHRLVEDELRPRLGIPDGWDIAATLTAGWPEGRHGPLSRKPVEQVVSIDGWARG